MNIIISALHFKWQDISECLKTAAEELGLDGVEMSWQKSSFVRGEIDALASLRKPENLMLSAHIWEDLARLPEAESQQCLLNWLDVCRKTGTASLVIHGGSCAEQREGIAKTRRIFEKVLPRYEAARVVLNLENHYAYSYRNCCELFSEPWEFLEVLAIDSPSLKFCFDTGHGNMTKNSMQLLQTLSPWLNYIHLADNHGIDDDHTAYGEGNVDWPGLFAQLKKDSFDKTFCVEFPVFDNRQPFFKCVDDISRHFRRQEAGDRS